MTKCSLCPTGTTSKAGSEYCSCAAGDYWNETNCAICPQGFVSQEGALECQECPLGSSSDKTRTTCTCPDEKIWKWSEESKISACVSPQPSKTGWHISNGILIVILSCAASTGLLTLVVLLVGSLFIHEKRKRRKESEGPVKVVYNIEGNDPAVHIVDEERRVREQVELPVQSQVIVPEEATCRSEVEDSQGSDESENIYADLS